MRSLPFHLTELPATIRDDVGAGIEDEMYEEAIDALSDHLADGGERASAVLLALAFCLVEDARTCMVDDVEENAIQALALADEAVAAGAAAKPLSSWLAQVRRLRDDARREREATAALAERAIEALSISEMKKAARALPNDAPGTEKKLALYTVIEAREREAKARGEKGNPSWFRACRASALAAAGRYDEARPIIDEIVAGRPGAFDQHWIGQAHAWLLDEAMGRGDATLFVERWRAAMAASREIPGAFAQQEAGLAFALERRLPEQAAHLAGLIRARKRRELTPAACALLERFDATRPGRPREDSTRDWRARLTGALVGRGHDSLTDYARTEPTDPLTDLAEKLDCAVAAIQLETVLEEEAVRKGRYDEFVRSMFVRVLHSRVPEGWNRGDKADFRAASAYGRFAATMGRRNRDASRAAWSALKAAAPPAGWLPEGPDDDLVRRAIGAAAFTPPTENANDSVGTMSATDDELPRRVVPPCDSAIEEEWSRDTKEPEVRSVNVRKFPRETSPWQVIVGAAEFVREEPLESEMRRAVATSLRAVPGVTRVAEDDRERWVVAGTPVGEALAKAAANAVDGLADKIRAHIKAGRSLRLTGTEENGAVLTLARASGRDAVIANAAAVALTSLHEWRLTCKPSSNTAARGASKPRSSVDEAAMAHLGADGVVKSGTEVSPGMVLVEHVRAPGTTGAVGKMSLWAPPGTRGVVVEAGLDAQGATVLVRGTRPLAIGDLLRAGNSTAVVGGIADLPPGIDALWPGLEGRHVVSKLACADDVLRARSIGPYSIVTCQPVAADPLPGQRVGGAEVRALLARGATHVLHEMLTVKSDDEKGRVQTYESIVLGRPACVPTVPDSTRVLEGELRALGFDVDLERDAIAIRLATSTELRATAGAVKSPEMLDYRTHRPVEGGLFCETIFGTLAPERRRRLGRIDLPAPVMHPWGTGPAALLLGVPEQRVLDVLYEARNLAGEETSTAAETGAAAVRSALATIDLVALAADGGARGELARGMRAAGTAPDALALDAWPVLPPGLRPHLPLANGKVATSDLNDHYRDVVKAANNLRRQLDLRLPDAIVRAGQVSLQRAIDALVHNGLRGKVVEDDGRPLKSLADMIGGPRGRLAVNLSGKRTDYSAIGRVVEAGDLGADRARVPRDAALELWRPWIYERLEAARYVDKLKDAKRLVTERDPRALAALDEVVRSHPIIVFAASPGATCDALGFHVTLWDASAIGLPPAAIDALGLAPGASAVLHVPIAPRAIADTTFRLRGPRPSSPAIELSPGDGWLSRAARAPTAEIGGILYGAALRGEIDRLTEPTARLLLGRLIG